MKVKFKNHGKGHGIATFCGKEKLSIEVDDGNIRSLALEDMILFPGLINAHDHLEFNLFPDLSDSMKYQDYKEWGGDIHKRNKEKIESVLKIPLELRIKWGVLKNLLNGVTYTVHHGGHHDVIKKIDYPVYLNYQYLHSLATEPNWKVKLNLPLTKDVMIHIGEGVNADSRCEVEQLIKWNFLRRKLIGIHAIALDSVYAKHFKAIVWCPDSNIRLYGQTAPVNQLKHHTTILFGTDSSLSASSNVWEQLRLARKLDLLSDKEIYCSLVQSPRNVFGDIGSSNSWVIARRKYENTWDAFFSVQPEDVMMVINKNEVVLIDDAVASPNSDEYIPVNLGKDTKWVSTKLANVILELESMGVNLPLGVSSSKSV